MAPGDVFPSEMPEHPPHPIVPLDGDTAERLLSGRLLPDDAPPGYAAVAKLLRAAAGPPAPDELSGQAAAMAAFRGSRTEGRSRAGGPRPEGSQPDGSRGPAGPPAEGAGAGRRRPARWRARVVAIALAGTLAATGVSVAGGLWTADRTGPATGLVSPSAGAGAGGAGSGAPGSAGPARPAATTVTAPVPEAGHAVPPPASGSVGAGPRSKPPRPRPLKPKPEKPGQAKPKPPKPSPPEPPPPEPSSPEPNTARPQVAKPDPPEPNTARPEVAKPDPAEPEASKGGASMGEGREAKPDNGGNGGPG